MAKKTRQAKTPTLVSKNTIAAKTQRVPYVSRVKEIQEAYLNDITSKPPKILAASIRNVEHLNLVAQYADIATCPPKVIWETFKHKLTLRGLQQFRDDWEKVQAL